LYRRDQNQIADREWLGIAAFISENRWAEASPPVCHRNRGFRAAIRRTRRVAVENGFASAYHAIKP
jgi:hypothetical protein